MRHASTGLIIYLEGYDSDTGKIIDPYGGIVLSSECGVIAAKWDFSKLLVHWKVKHNQAVYIPSLSNKIPVREYLYGEQVLLGEGTDFSMLLKAVSSNAIYYDLGIKMENVS